MFEELLPLFIKAVEWFFITVFVKYILFRWFAGKVSDFLKYCLVRTQAHMVSWIHYREKAMKQGHQYATPELCRDGVCKSYQAKVSTLN